MATPNTLPESDDYIFSSVRIIKHFQPSGKAMVNHQTVLTLAKQGEAQAIALLINQALHPKGIRVRVVRKDRCLHVLLDAAQIPERFPYSRIVYAAVFCLGISELRTLQVYGRRQGDQLPSWTEAFRLIDPKLRPGNRDSRTASPEAMSLQSTPGTSLPVAPAKLALPIALTVFASFGAGAGLSYFKQGQFKQLPAEAVETTTTLPGAPVAGSTTVQPAENPALAAFPTPSTTPAAIASATPTKSNVALTIKAVGDIIPGSNYPGKALPTELGEALAAEKELLFGNIQPFFDQADILFGNFESTLTDHPYSAKDTSQNMTFAFRNPPVYAQMLKEVGFDVLSVANNHSLDFGEQGFADTIAHIEQAGMKAVGQKGQIVYTTVNQIPVAFIGFSYLPDHNAMQDLATASALVQEAKKQAKIVVISVHAGAEGSDQIHTVDHSEYFFGEDRGNLVTFAHTLVDQGADLILGHGPHVPRAVELYQGKLIAYSLGNFVGYQTLSTVGTLGDSLILNVQMDAEGNFVGGRVIPVALDKDGIPHLDDFFQSVVLIRNLIKSDFPQSPITLDDMGYILRVSN